MQTPDFKSQYKTFKPAVEIGLPFKPRAVGVNYFAWAKLPELFPVSFPGVKTSRDDVLVDTDKERLITRMEQYFNPAVSHEEMRRIASGFMDSSARYNAETIRDQLRKRGFLRENIVRYAFRPFDVRWLYWEPETKLLDEKRADYFGHAREQNPTIFITNRTRRGDIQSPLLTTVLNDINSMDGSAAGFPLYLYANQQPQLGLFEADPTLLGGHKPNLSDMAKGYLATVEADEKVLFYHTLAVLHSPIYRTENAGALRQDWPRVPLPKNPEALRTSAELGEQVAALLDVETPVVGVTAGDPAVAWREVARLTTVNGGAPDFTVNAGWGHFGVGSAVMPGRGRVNSTPAEGILTPSPSTIQTPTPALPRTQGREENGAVDVYLNDTTYWRNVPQGVWEYTLGGYQVLKKWLSYRETAILGRTLKAEEAREFMQIVRRIAALLALNAALDTNYEVVRESSGQQVSI